MLDVGSRSRLEACAAEQTFSYYVVHMATVQYTVLVASMRRQARGANWAGSKSSGKKKIVLAKNFGSWHEKIMMWNPDNAGEENQNQEPAEDHGGPNHEAGNGDRGPDLQLLFRIAAAQGTLGGVFREAVNLADGSRTWVQYEPRLVVRPLPGESRRYTSGPNPKLIALKATGRYYRVPQRLTGLRSRAHDTNQLVELTGISCVAILGAPVLYWELEAGHQVDAPVQDGNGEGPNPNFDDIEVVDMLSDEESDHSSLIEEHLARRRRRLYGIVSQSSISDSDADDSDPFEDI